MKFNLFFLENISSIGNGANNAFYEGPPTQDSEAKPNGWMSYKYEDNKKAPKGCFKRLSCFHSDLTSSSSSSSSASSHGTDSMVGMSRYPSRAESTKSNSTQSMGSTTFTAMSDSSSKNSSSTQISSRENLETNFQAAHSVYINQMRADNQPDSDLFYTFKFW